MLPDKTERSRPRSKRSGVEFEEERAWVTFYRRVGHDVAIAAEVLSQLEADPDRKRTQLALYLCCRESLRSHKARQARNKRVGQIVRWFCDMLLLRPAQALRRGLNRSGSIAFECLPDSLREPAVSKVHRIRREAAFAKADSSNAGSTTSQPAPLGAVGSATAAPSPSRATVSSAAA